MSKPIWKIIIFVIGVMALWRSSLVSLQIWDYVQLEREATTEEVEWEIIPKGSKYALQATYGYTVLGKKFICKQLLNKPYYLNRSSAEKQIQKVTGMAWTVWIDPKDPRHAKIEKNFPYRETVYAACLLAILLYFLGLKFHLEMFKEKH